MDYLSILLPGREVPASWNHNTLTLVKMWRPHKEAGDKGFVYSCRSQYLKLIQAFLYTECYPTITAPRGLTLVMSMKAVLFLGAALGGEEDLFTWGAFSCNNTAREEVKASQKQSRTFRLWEIALASQHLHWLCKGFLYWRCFSLSRWS